ncbi:hypothetical protein GCM10023091_25770 [Ravibacter arvi]|uniref:Tetratricopeptide repeat protein n=1 Tax=Ravibacter arvi TaxID=2051041 RepID=A0ABP8M1I0_9BACT
MRHPGFFSACFVFLFSGIVSAQSFRKCEELLAEAQQGLNQAFEQNDLSKLKSRAYLRKLHKLRKAYSAYHRAYFDEGDSVAKANNEAVLLFLGRQYGKAFHQLSMVRDPVPLLEYHKGLSLLGQGDYRRAAGLLQKSAQENASLNALVALGKLPEPADGLALARRYGGSQAKGAYNAAILLERAGEKEKARTYLDRAAGQSESAWYRIRRADLLMELGLTAQAAADFEAFGRKMPGGTVRMANAYMVLGQYEQAKALFDAYLKSGDQHYRAEASLGIANSMYSLGEYETARNYYERAATHTSTRIGGICGLGNIALVENRYAQARKLWELVLSRDSTNRSALRGRAISLYGVGDYDGALRGFEALVGEADMPAAIRADLLVCRGYSYYNTGQPEKAARDFQQAIKIDPSWFEAHAGLGMIAIDRRKYPEAGKHLLAALAYEKKNDRLWTNYGNLLMHFDMYDKAFSVFKTASELNPNSLNAQNGRGITLLERDLLPESKALFDSLVKTNPGKSFLLNNRGIVSAYLGNRASQREEAAVANKSYTRAQNDFEAAMASAPEKKFYNVNKGNVLRYWQQYEDARDSYQSYQDKSALNNTAVLLAGLERLKDAKYYMGVALQIDSTHRAFQYNMNLLANGRSKETAKFVASARDDGPYSEISLKYSLDGYVTIYLYDYLYERILFKGRHQAELPRVAFTDDYLIPEFDFSFLPYSPKEKQTNVKKRSVRMPRTKGKRSRSGTQCPVF